MITIWKDKEGNSLTTKEFLSRWKQGIDNITPMQRLRNEKRGTAITLLGFIVSFAAVIWKRDTIGVLSYGLILIFLGSIITTGLKYLALRAQYKFMEKLEKEVKND